MSHVLLIEDHDQLRAMYTLMLESVGYTVTAAENGSVGLERLRSAFPRPDVVLTDIVMPVLDGIGFIEAARQENLELPIIAMSGGSSGNGNKLQAAALAGACATLAKPFLLSDLRAALVRALQNAAVVAAA